MAKNILTIAVGKRYYIELAVNLARSFFWWHPNSDIIFTIVTDNAEALPDDIKQKVQIRLIKPGEFGEGFSPKMRLDKLAPVGQTIFLDSDCLIFDNLTPLFERFAGKSVSVVGGYISSGEWFGNVAEICKQFDVPHLLKFNGGLYYIEKGDVADKVYATARELESRYDEIGFVRFRNSPADEMVMALAMQLHGQSPINDDGTIMSDPQACPGPYKIDVISGYRVLINPSKPDPRHQAWYPFEKVSPLIVHFLGEHAQHYPYEREIYRLKKVLTNKLTVFNKLYILTAIEYPARIKIFLKNTFRASYHRLFGARKIKQSKRLGIFL